MLFGYPKSWRFWLRKKMERMLEDLRNVDSRERGKLPALLMRKVSHIRVTLAVPLLSLPANLFLRLAKPSALSIP